MTDIAFWPTRQRAPRRRVPILALAAALALLAWASAPRVILDWRDLTCPEGYGAKPLDIIIDARRCEPNTAESQWPRSAQASRYVGLFLTRFDARVFDYDFGNMHGFGLNVPVR